MAIYTYNWCKIEGTIIKDTGKVYSNGLKNIPSSIKIFYGIPELTIENPYSTTDGVHYKIIPLTSFNSAYNTIPDIDANYDAIQKDIKDQWATISPADGTKYYHKPEGLLESCVIYHGDSSHTTYDYASLVLIDTTYVGPEIIAIKADYIGPGVPVGEEFDINYFKVYAIYEDGNSRLVAPGDFAVEPVDQKVTVLGSNVVTVKYKRPDDTIITDTCVVEGVKNLSHITGLWDANGPIVSINTEAERKWFVITAHYTDGSSVTVGEFTFPNGNIVTHANGALIDIYYKGCTCQVLVPTYEPVSSRLIAYYNGPNIEVGKSFDITKCTVKIYYGSVDDLYTRYEIVNVNDCTFSHTTISHEGNNQITVSYTGELGVVSTTLIVIGIKPEKTLNFIEAEYTGPNIVVGKAYNPEKVVCKAHYSDGSIIVVKNFTLGDTVVHLVGVNEYSVSFTDQKTDHTCFTTITVTGVAPDSTTENGYTPFALPNFYPEATYYNNRYRGPAEAYKRHNFSQFLYDNINAINTIFQNIEKDFNALNEKINNNDAVKVKVFNDIKVIQDNVNTWYNDDRFTTGYFIEREGEINE